MIGEDWRGESTKPGKVSISWNCFKIVYREGRMLICRTKAKIRVEDEALRLKKKSLSR